MKISQAAFDLIVQEETGGESYYRKTEQSTDWPGGASGVTIGIGYDCGYASRKEIAFDWDGSISPAMIAALQDCAGITGSPARSHALAIRHVIDVPWAVALAVFQKRDVPKWEDRVAAVVPNTDKLSGDSFGALVSLAFNRGASFGGKGDRYREMRAIRQAMIAKNFKAIPGLLREMKRIWPPGSAGHADLTARREHEAVLFEKGLA